MLIVTFILLRLVNLISDGKIIFIATFFITGLQYFYVKNVFKLYAPPTYRINEVNVRTACYKIAVFL